jgi:hypothetical protein
MGNAARDDAAVGCTCACADASCVVATAAGIDCALRNAYDTYSSTHACAHASRASGFGAGVTTNGGSGRLQYCTDRSHADTGDAILLENY